MKFMYSIDQSFKQFFKLIMELDESKDEPDCHLTRSFLVNRASQLLDKIADMMELGTFLPSCPTPNNFMAVGPGRDETSLNLQRPLLSP